LIEGAIRFAGELIKGKCLEIAKEEFDKAKKAGLDAVLSELKASKKPAVEEAEVVAPPKEVVISQISGIEIMDLEDAVKLLWKNGVYAESGMGCTGPIILVSEAKTNEALKILADNDFIAKEQEDC
jgi:glycine reductase